MNYNLDLQDKHPHLSKFCQPKTEITLERGKVYVGSATTSIFGYSFVTAIRISGVLEKIINTNEIELSSGWIIDLDKGEVYSKPDQGCIGPRFNLLTFDQRKSH
jgi:hypothetical protein